MTPHEMVFGYKPQIPLSLKLGLLRNLDLGCSSQFCENLPAHTNSTQDSQNKAIARLLLPPVSCDLLTRENTLKKLFCDAYRKSLETTARSHKYRNQYRLAKPLPINQNVLLENHFTPLNISKKLCQLRLGPYSVLKQITNVNYEIALDADPSVTLVAHRNHLVEYFPKEEKLPQLLAEYQNPRKETFYQNLDQKRLEEMNKPITKETFQGKPTEFLPVFSPNHLSAEMPTHSFPPLSNVSTPDSGFGQDRTPTPLSRHGLVRTPTTTTPTYSHSTATPIGTPSSSNRPPTPSPESSMTTNGRENTRDRSRGYGLRKITRHGYRD